MPAPTDVLPLMDQGDQLLQVDSGTGRGFYQHPEAPSRFSASLSGPVGMGGSLKPPSGVQATQASPKGSYKPPSPEELMALANQMQSQYDFEPGPSQVEPTLERETSVPYWLRNYAEKEGIDKADYVPESKSKNQIVPSKTGLNQEDKRKYML